MAFAHPRLSYGQEGLTLWLDSERTWGKENKKYLFFDRCNLEIYRTTSTLTLTIRDVG